MRLKFWITDLWQIKEELVHVRHDSDQDLTMLRKFRVLKDIDLTIGLARRSSSSGRR